MRIAYIAPYQSPALVKRRPIVRNLSLAGRVKVEQIAELLTRSGHDVEIISQGEVIQHRFELYPAFADPEPFHKKIPVYYASAFPVRFLNGLWSSLSTLRIFKARHRISRYNVVLIYNLKPPQVICAKYAIRRLDVPVILDYEDDAFLDRGGKRDSGSTAGFYLSAAKRLLNSVSGCVAVSPYLLAQIPPSIPKLLLSGVVSDEIVNANNSENRSKRNWVVFSGTHFRTFGLEQLIKAWGMAELTEWELHIAGHGEMTTTLQRLAHGNKSIVFHGLLNKKENARLLSFARIGINPHDVTQAPGGVFPMKIMEYFASGAHVISTPIGVVEPEFEAGITYMSDNSPEKIAAVLKHVIQNHRYERTAEQAALQNYGPMGVSQLLERLIQQVMSGRNSQ